MPGLQAEWSAHSSEVWWRNSSAPRVPSVVWTPGKLHLGIGEIPQLGETITSTRKCVQCSVSSHSEWTSTRMFLWFLVFIQYVWPVLPPPDFGYLLLYEGSVCVCVFFFFHNALPWEFSDSNLAPLNFSPTAQLYVRGTLYVLIWHIYQTFFVVPGLKKFSCCDFQVWRYYWKESNVWNIKKPVPWPMGGTCYSILRNMNMWQVIWPLGFLPLSTWSYLLMSPGVIPLPRTTLAFHWWPDASQEAWEAHLPILCLCHQTRGQQRFSVKG